ncbi:hypothetical protein CANINC_003735 [Pichia inconspicua]|uniref:PX domain-containing protein n=1 Tax=Pichia inconspicua TaxID=52247 RepID=A0A4V6TTQ2_9ASCO|nr:hypothetical protein CANINC_003735 [[Candida] inconspicua]
MNNVWNEDDGWGDTDPFKLQNELAQTMQSIHIGPNDRNNDDKDDDPDDKDNNHDDVNDHYYSYKNEAKISEYPISAQNNSFYGEESANSLRNPFLVNAPEQANEQVDVEILKEKKHQLLESLTAESKEDSFLKPETIENVDELLSGPEDSKVAKLMTLTSTPSQNHQSKNNDDTKDHVERLQSRIISPTRRVKLLRARRVKAHSEAVHDPLSAPLTSTKDSDSLNLTKSTSPHSMKQKLISESDSPLFNLKKEDLLSKVNEPIDPTKASLEDDVELIKDEEPEPFEILVGDPLKVGELTNAHVVYTITTKTTSKLFTYPDTTVTRRYSDFLWLYNRLLNNHPGYIIPPPPEKQAYGRFDDKFIENRRLALEKMLQKIANRKIFQDDKDLITFLQSENFAIDSKRNETNESSDLENIRTMSEILLININLGINESSNGGGFFGSLIGLNNSKYVEEDPFILGKQEYIKSLDAQLRQLSQSLDMILEKREELSSSLSDVTLILQQLADLEINTEISEILVNFEELQIKIKELLDNQNTSQILTFGSTIDEYIRNIGSVRNCFENRLKICNSIAILKQHLDKKEHNLIKFRSKNSSQTDKVKLYEAEVAKYNKFYELQSKFKDQFDLIFRSELKKFEVAKITDFKNMIEIYWEGLIESQKLLIELWETFYDKCNFA